MDNDQLAMFSEQELLNELRRRKLKDVVVPDFDPVGVWRVTTEGDCEGRTTVELGFWEGHIADIAFYLDNCCGYSLHFSKCNELIRKPLFTKNVSSGVSISFDFDLKTPVKLEPEERSEIISKVLHSKPSGVNFECDTKGYGTIRLILKEEENKND